MKEGCLIDLTKDAIKKLKSRFKDGEQYSKAQINKEINEVLG